MHPKARETFLQAVDQGWHDPRKLGHQSAKTAILRQEALSSIAGHLGVNISEVEVIGEPALATFYAIQGLLRAGDHLLHSAIDRKEVHAIAQSWPSVSQMSILPNGKIALEELERSANNHHGVFALQVANGETGVIQDIEKLVSNCDQFQIACDYTQVLVSLPLPSRWSTASYSASTWQGPTGVGIIVINKQARWENPLPHIGIERTPNSVSLPLLLASAIALDEWSKDKEAQSQRLRAMNVKVRNGISQIENAFIAGNLEESMENLISASFLDVEGEELLRALELEGICVDSGSACSSDNLRPSHVLGAMGMLTHGNVRITLHSAIGENEVDRLIEAITRNVAALRS
ncbi:unannotated protein [freshwater metagenome]|uniref:Unannotated protein n=1 Tax=freshwater metagenome TaxID=449393 RepID=A0A6J6FD32_9ZZZZ